MITEKNSYLFFKQNMFWWMLSEENECLVFLECRERKKQFRVLDIIEFENNKYEILAPLGEDSENLIYIFATAMTDDVNHIKAYSELFSNCYEFEKVRKIFESKDCAMNASVCYANVSESIEEKRKRIFCDAIDEWYWKNCRIFKLNEKDNTASNSVVISLTDCNHQNLKSHFKIFDSFNYDGCNCEILVKANCNSCKNVLVCYSFIDDENVKVYIEFFVGTKFADRVLREFESRHNEKIFNYSNINIEQFYHSNEFKEI